MARIRLHVSLETLLVDELLQERSRIARVGAVGFVKLSLWFYRTLRKKPLQIHLLMGSVGRKQIEMMNRK